jgi:WD40 repeat protein
VLQASKHCITLSTNEWHREKVRCRVNNTSCTDAQLLQNANELLAKCEYNNRYPCIGARAEAVVGFGHSSHVTNVKFSHDQSRVVTTGGNDGCILQWAVIKT